MRVKKFTLYTDDETLEFDSQRQLADYLGLNNYAKSKITRKCKKLGYEIDFPINPNDLPLK